MAKLSYMLQIFTGGFNEHATTYEQILKKLTPLLGKLPIMAVIAGWQIHADLYKHLKDLLSAYDIPLFLWMPVFSEISDIKAGEKVTLASGEEMARFELGEGEGFDFLCPNSETNLQNVFDTYTEHFKDVGFDGIFLDRIRYPSFSNGYESIFTCFCDRCKSMMEDQQLPIDWYQEQVADAKSKSTSAFSIKTAAYPSHMLSDHRWRLFFDFKHRCITDALSRAIDHFKGDGLKVGLDVFSPFITDFIGQDIPSLSKQVDFIKPMMYHKTYAPAGIPFEISKFYQGFSQDVTNDSLNNETEAFNEMVHMSACPIHPGFEVNHIPNIAETSVAYIETQLDQYERHPQIDTVVLSWNLLDMPKAHLDYLLKRNQM